MESNYLLAPKANHGFSCKVPMKGTRQVFVVNGKVEGTGKPLALSFPKGEVNASILQVIGVRTTVDGLQAGIAGVCGANGTAAAADSQQAIELNATDSIEFGEGCNEKLLLCSHTFTPDRFVTNEQTRITLHRGATADITVMQNEDNRSKHFTDYTIDLEEGSSLKMVFISLHGGEISNNLKVNLNGEHIDCIVNGLCLADGDQKMTTQVLMEHFKPNCTSNQLFKYILDDHAVADFFGLIRVAPNAQKTNAYQANHNLLISDDAKVHTKPQLEIYADDVKCSHGSTIGRLNDDELFYLRSRGISLPEARLLQQKAFANGVLETISNENLRLRMESLVDKRLRGEFSSCKNCSKNCC
jgi:Fe-S cluster assembly protein SufD